MKKENHQTDVLELEAEEMLPELQLEKKIEQTLVKANVTEQVIAALKEKYGSLRLKDINDKESYLELVEGRKNVRKIAILAEKACKSGRENAVREQKLWLQKEKEVCNKIAEIQDPLDADIKKFEDEIERKEIEAAKQREAVYMNRQTILSRLGATYNNGSFELKHISYEIELIKQADEEQWNDTILPKYKKVYEEIEAERVAEENKRKAEAERLKAEQEKFAEEQKIFREQQQEFQKQKAEAERQKLEEEKQMRLIEESRLAEEKKKKQELVDARLSRLRTLDINFDLRSNQYTYIDDEISIADDLHKLNINIPVDLYSVSDFEWDALLETISPLIEAKKKEVEKKRADKIEQDIIAAKQLAAQQEREKIAEEQRQAEIKKQQDEQRKAEELALAGDKQKYSDVVGYLTAYPKHAMKSNIYKGKMNAIAQFIQNL